MEPTLEEKREHALGLIRIKIRAGVWKHPDWPPPGEMSIEHQMVYLDRLAEKILRDHENQFYKV